MTAVQQHLRRIDQEITGLRQQIARCQVEIARLEDARLVLVALAERDQLGASAEEPPLLSGNQGPLLVVRKAHSGDGEEGAKKRTAWNKGMKGSTGGKRSPEAGATRDKIMELFRHRRVLDPIEVIGALLGDNATKRQKHQIYNSLLALKKQGKLHQTQLGEPYALATHVNGPS
jgi:hypothetical protein